MKVKVIGAGMAGCEAAWQLSRKGCAVQLYEMRPKKMTDAHSSGGFAELVCSNSFRSANIMSAVGLLHEELRCMESLIMRCADQAALPAGGALAVDREKFSALVEKEIDASDNIEVIKEEVAQISEDERTIIATGPLTSNSLAKDIIRITKSSDDLAFFDAIAPIVYEDSIDYDIVWKQSRYDKGGDDYINCPMDRDEYDAFIDALIDSEKTDFKDWEKSAPYFEGCLPIEVMASRGRDTLRFGPMKPVGLSNPHKNGERPYAVVQLRVDNASGTLYNIVGFQTKIKYAEQAKVFHMIPGLKNARFARLGGIHRNTFINSPRLLNDNLSLKGSENIKFAGQITGVEGYIESAAIGLLAGIFMAGEINGVEMHPPRMSALGSLVNHIVSDANDKTFQPMNINYGLFPPLNARGAAKKELYAEKSLANIKVWADDVMQF